MPPCLGLALSTAPLVAASVALRGRRPYPAERRHHRKKSKTAIPFSPPCSHDNSLHSASKSVRSLSTRHYVALGYGPAEPLLASPTLGLPHGRDSLSPLLRAQHCARERLLRFGALAAHRRSCFRVCSFGALSCNVRNLRGRRRLSGLRFAAVLAVFQISACIYFRTGAILPPFSHLSFPAYACCPCTTR